jgi:hypothetical protein
MAMQAAQLFDLVETKTTGPIEFSQWAGKWINSNPDTTGIARLEISEARGEFYLEIHAISPGGLIPWGRTRIKTLAANPTSRKGAGFTCSYDFDFVTVRLQAMIVKGLIVLGQFHAFKDDSGRASFFVREYFAIEHGRY